MIEDYEDLFRTLTRRYGAVTPEAMVKVLCPLHVPIASLDKTMIRVPGQQHYRASFTIDITPTTSEILVVGRTGKFIPRAHLSGEPWREIAKGRITSLDPSESTAEGEIYVGAGRPALQKALAELTELDVLEVDQYGAAAKVLSALVEATLATQLTMTGFQVRRMPEDTAQHLGVYPNYDFQVVREGTTKKLEVKSLWGTNTQFARLIHSAGRDYPTSSCKFATQDFFAVSLFLRTGNISD